MVEIWPSGFLFIRPTGQVRFSGLNSKYDLVLDLSQIFPTGASPSESCKKAESILASPIPDLTLDSCRPTVVERSKSSIT